MDSLPAHLRDSYARDFRLADDAFYSGRLEATSRVREKYWNHWQKYSAPVGVDPYLQGTNFQKRIRLLSGFAARVRTGYVTIESKLATLFQLRTTFPLDC